MIETIPPLTLPEQDDAAPILHGRILLAEDGLHNQQVMAYYLSEAGAEVGVAGNGKVACEMAIAAMEHGESFDLIVMDLQMPVMDGHAAGAAIRAAGFVGPLVAITSQAADGMQRDLKFSAHISKPIDRDDFIQIIAEALCGHDDPVHPAISGIVDCDILRSTAAADPDLAPFLPGFIADLPGIVARVSALLDAGNIAELAGSIHQIKGIGGLYGFAPMTEAATRAELSILESAQFQRIANEVKSLIALIRRVEGYEPAKELPLKGQTL